MAVSPFSAQQRFSVRGRTIVSALWLGLGLEEVFVFDSKGENRDRAVEAVESVSEARARVRVRMRVSS